MRPNLSEDLFWFFCNCFTWVWGPGIDLHTPWKNFSLRPWGNAYPHQELASPHRDLASPHQDLSAGWSDKKGPVSTNKFCKIRPKIVPNCGEYLFFLVFTQFRGRNDIISTEVLITSQMRLVKAAKVSRHAKFYSLSTGYNPHPYRPKVWYYSVRLLWSFRTNVVLMVLLENCDFCLEKLNSLKSTSLLPIISPSWNEQRLRRMFLLFLLGHLPTN